ncbi:MAG: hypothetical protein ACLFUJ_06390 [Phycisphaerae bacterium]
MIGRNRLQLAAFCLVAGLAFSASLADGDPPRAKASDQLEAKPQIDADAVRGLIKQLSDDDHVVRDQATEQLKKIGPGATDLVTEAMKDKDASKEVAFRCKQILEVYRLAAMPETLAKASLKGTGKLDNFTRHDKKEVYVGAHSMRGTYRYSPFYMLLKELAVIKGIVPQNMAQATLKTRDISWTLPVPLKNWPEGQAKPDQSFIDKRVATLIETGQRHERTRGRIYLQRLNQMGMDLPVPEAWKEKSKDDQKDRVRGRS